MMESFKSVPDHGEFCFLILDAAAAAIAGLDSHRSRWPHCLSVAVAVDC